MRTKQPRTHARTLARTHTHAHAQAHAHTHTAARVAGGARRRRPLVVAGPGWPGRDAAAAPLACGESRRRRGARRRESVCEDGCAARGGESMRGGARSGETPRCEPRRTARRLVKGPSATGVGGLGGGQLLVVVGLLHSLKTIYDECRSRPASRARVGDRERGRRACAAPGPQAYTHTRTRGWGTVGGGGVLALRGCRQVPSHVPVTSQVTSPVTSQITSQGMSRVTCQGTAHVTSPVAPQVTSQFTPQGSARVTSRVCSR